MWGRFGVGAVAGALVVLVAVASSAQAAQIWDGDASRGRDVFGNIGGECASPGSVTAVDDATQGRVWRFNKPSGLNRCEARGIKVNGARYSFSNNSTYYLGWRSKLSSTTNNNATFQWKSYQNHTQNFPIVLKMIGGKLTMLQRQPGGREYHPWSRTIRANEWHHIVLGIHTSSATTGGWVELYFDGEPQSFANGQRRWPCRSWDSYNDPKWGIYGARGTSLVTYVDGLRIGTSYGDVR
jgi:hypothetical protein